jgi:hypothetical protein
LRGTFPHLRKKLTRKANIAFPRFLKKRRFEYFRAQGCVIAADNSVKNPLIRPALRELAMLVNIFFILSLIG